MTLRTRAMVIGLMGPFVQAIGLLWEACHLLLYHLHEPLSLRHIVFEPGFLVIFTGFLVSAVCVPVAVDVARASEKEVSVPLLGAVDKAELTEGRPA